MIKINLLPHRRTKRRAGPREPGSKDLVIGVVCLVAAAALVFVAVDHPRRAELSDLHGEINQLQSEIAAKNQKLKGYAQLQKVASAARKRAKAIHRLLDATTVPANVMHELGEILTPNQLPTMTQRMARLTGANGDPNKTFDLTWDPTRVWLTSFVDKKGKFTLKGGAQAESDVTQFSKRLAASAYFMDVAPKSENRAFDNKSGITYYQFTITGKVAY